MKYEKWLYEWLEHYVKPTAKSRTHSRYSEIVAQHIVPKLGEYELEELTPSVLQHYITELLQKGNIIGIRVAIAKKNEEKINAKDMVKHLIVGIIVAFVFAGGLPLFVKGLAAWIGG